MEAEFINPFLQATVKVLATMASMNPKPGKPGIKQDEAAKGDITGIIGITSHAEGSMSVTFSERCALAVVRNMTGEDLAEMNDDVADARSQFQKIGFSFTAAIPTIVRGKNHTVKHIATGGPTVCIPFSTEQGNFWVEARFSG